MNDSPRPLLTTSRLALRPAAESDATFMLTLLNDPEFVRGTWDRGIRTEAGAIGYIQEKLQRHHSEHGYSMYLVTLRSSGIPIGTAGFIRRDYLPNPDLGYGFLGPYSGQGYATEACRALLDYARHQLEFSTVLGLTAEDNPRSIAVLRKIGLRFDRTEQFAEWDDPTLIYRIELKPSIQPAG